LEMWPYRRILKIRKEKEVVLKRKLEYFGHILRHEKFRLLQLVVQGKVDSKREPGRRRHSWLHNLRQWFGLSSDGLFRSAVNKTRIAMLIATSVTDKAMREKSN